jgi:glutamine amidotransferase
LILICNKLGVIGQMLKPCSGRKMIAIIDYKAGNLKSVERALKKLGAPCCITSNRQEILSSKRIIFPGVGAAGKAMADLKDLGLDKILINLFNKGKPILGICLGAQIILERSEEDGARCLGLLEGRVRRFSHPFISPENEPLKVPHMGWNGVRMIRGHPVLRGIMPSDEFYFVHSYYPIPSSEKNIIGLTNYGLAFPSIIGRRNLIAVQFHPEKSGRQGLRILENFCKWDGTHAQ